LTKVSCAFAASDFPIGKSAAHKTATILIQNRWQQAEKNRENRK